MKTMLTVLILTLATAPAFAQKQRMRARVKTPQTRVFVDRGSHLLAVDLFVLTASGVGGSYDYFISDNLGFGIMGDFAELKGQENKNIKSRVTRMGAGAVLTNRHPSRGAWYLRGGAITANAETTAQLQLTSGEAKRSSNGTGLMAAGGYMFAGRDFGGSRLMFNGGLTYSLGSSVNVKGEETYSTFEGHRHSMDATLNSSVSLEVKIGLLF